MLFNSPVFLLFITIVLLIYPRLRLRGQNVFLLISSYVFYGYWDWRFNFLLLISTIVDFFVGQKLYNTNNEKHRLLLVMTSIAVNLGILGFFKYFNFFVGSAEFVLNNMGLQPNLPVLRIILPVGISFYTFQTMSYTIGVYRHDLAPSRNFVDFALFVAFFPQLVAGPIERASNLLPQITSPRRLTRKSLLTGLNLVLLGYFKKVAIADVLAPIVDRIFATPELMTSGELLTGIIAFSFQIYGDFSGYTDIARGVARILGFDLMMNFRTPYLSRNITEFWRRWHISLSSWLRDYLYITLGGNRHGKVRAYVNMILTMLVGGLWHGAAWNFVVWGALHGTYLSVHRIFLRENSIEMAWPRRPIEFVFAVGRMIFTYCLVGFAWIFFRAPNLYSAITYLQGLIRLDRLNDVSPVVLFAAVIVLILDIIQRLTGSDTWLTDGRSHRVWRYAVAQILSISVLAAGIAHFDTMTPFIYFQF